MYSLALALFCAAPALQEPEAGPLEEAHADRRISFQLKVLDVQGEPLPNHEVQARIWQPQEPIPGPPDLLRTDTEGHFDLAMPFGSHLMVSVVEVPDDGYPCQWSGRINEGFDGREFRFRIPGVRLLEVESIGPRQDPLPGGTLILGYERSGSFRSGDQGQRLPVVPILRMAIPLDEHGRARIEVPRMTGLTAGVHGTGHVWRTVAIPPIAQNLRLHGVPPDGLSMVVEDQDGNGIAGAEYWLLHVPTEPEGKPSSPHILEHGRSLFDGHIRLPSAEVDGHLTVVVSAPGMNLYWRDVNFDYGYLYQLKLKPETLMQGQVLDEERQPLAGTIVEVVDGPKGWHTIRRLLPAWDARFRSTTDAEGWFRIPGLMKGEYSLRTVGLDPEFRWTSLSTHVLIRLTPPDPETKD